MKIAFTSCSNIIQYPNQYWWKDIESQDPDYLFLLGDNIYMDIPKRKGKLKRMNADEYENEMRIIYNKQFQEVHFASLVEKMILKKGLYAIWDDHDFLWNDALGEGKVTALDREKMARSRSLFHQYFKNCSTNGTHLYYYLDIGPAQVLFLDNRTYAQIKDTNAKLLGDAQFEYIKESLLPGKDFTIICGGLTLTESMIKKFRGPADNWLDYPLDLVKLCEILSTYKNVLFLGGDIHRNGFQEPILLKDILEILKPNWLTTEAWNKLRTPPQFISSGIAIDRPDVVRNWALLKIETSGVDITYYKFDPNSTTSTKLDAKTTDDANEWLKENNYFIPIA
ncbi:MAG: alkaline phosphatase D family protein [Saprospiraceae bacterium]|nr:alkaline phosphatase D family protein [Saprospiraceae bacterium]MBK7737369.1 alkaline phosphatase D family protein [Saprospiraceae bacterium]MBK7914051.1 alkaline phosphatase D family protein [Saprospiraceae bacterium]